MPLRTLSLSDLQKRLMVTKRKLPITFVIGSGLTMPISENNGTTLGVAGADAIQHRILKRICEEPNSKEIVRELEDLLPFTSESYSKFFACVERHHIAPDICLTAIRQAVLGSFRHKRGADTAIDSLVEEATQGSQTACLELELATAHWFLRDGILHLGKLVVGNPSLFGNTIITTNFDPLIEVAIRSHQGSPVSIAIRESAEIIALHKVVHVHGQWFSHQMLNNPEEIEQRRNQLHTYLSRHLSNTDIVVSGYGGWDRALLDAIWTAANHGNHDIYWCLHGKADSVSGPVQELLKKAKSDQTTTLLLVESADCDLLFPALFSFASASNLLSREVPPATEPAQMPGSIPTLTDVLDKLHEIDKTVKETAQAARDIVSNEMRSLEDRDAVRQDALISELQTIDRTVKDTAKRTQDIMTNAKEHERESATRHAALMNSDTKILNASKEHEDRSKDRFEKIHAILTEQSRWKKLWPFGRPKQPARLAIDEMRQTSKDQGDGKASD